MPKQRTTTNASTGADQGIENTGAGTKSGADKLTPKGDESTQAAGVGQSQTPDTDKNPATTGLTDGKTSTGVSDLAENVTTDTTAGTGVSVITAETAPNPPAPVQNPLPDGNGDEPEDDTLLGVDFRGQPLRRNTTVVLGAADVASLPDRLRNQIFSVEFASVGGYINPSTAQYYIPAEHLAASLEAVEDDNA